MSPRPIGPDARRSLVRLVLTVGLPCLVLGGVAGFWAARTAAAPRPAPSAPLKATNDAPGESRSVVVAGPTTARLGDDDRAAPGALIREQLAAAHPREDAGRAADNPQPGDAGAAALTDAQRQSYDRARAAVDDAIAHGTWTPENRAELRATVAGLPAETAIEIVRPLLVAVNEGKVHWDGRGPLM